MDYTKTKIYFSPEKYLQFHESEIKYQPLEVTAIQRSLKRLGNSLDEYTIGKKSKILPIKLDFILKDIFNKALEVLYYQCNITV